MSTRPLPIYRRMPQTHSPPLRLAHSNTNNYSAQTMRPCAASSINCLISSPSTKAHLVKWERITRLNPRYAAAVDELLDDALKKFSAR